MRIARPQKGDMHITQWVPTSGKSPAWPVIQSWMNTEWPRGKHKWLRSIPGNIEWIWNDVIKKFLASDSDYLWSTHEDIQYHPQTLKHLLSWKKPLVSALVFMRHNPVMPHIWHKYEDGDGAYAMRVDDTRAWFYKHPEYIIHGPFVMDPKPKDALEEINFSSTACTLIHRSVLEDMKEFCEEKWFVLDHEQDGGGEDRRFHELAVLAGYPGYVDRSCIVGHMVGDVAADAFDFIGWDSISEIFNTGEPGRYKKPGEIQSLEAVERMEGQF